jgi:hypothetical protein
MPSKSVCCGAMFDLGLGVKIEDFINFVGYDVS